MSGSITVQVSLFGAFRSFCNEPTIDVVLPSGVKIPEIKAALKSVLKHNPAFNSEALVDESVLADDREILPEDAVLTRNTSLAILPPVCGG